MASLLNDDEYDGLLDDVLGDPAVLLLLQKVGASLGGYPAPTQYLSDSGAVVYAPALEYAIDSFARRLQFSDAYTRCKFWEVVVRSGAPRKVCHGAKLALRCLLDDVVELGRYRDSSLVKRGEAMNDLATLATILAGAQSDDEKYVAQYKKVCRLIEDLLEVGS